MISALTDPTLQTNTFIQAILDAERLFIPKRNQIEPKHIVASLSIAVITFTEQIRTTNYYS